MARQRPMTAIQGRPHQQRRNFSGSNNNLSRVSNHLLILALSTHDSLVTNAATFPAPPVAMATFLTDIQAFQAAKQALGVKGTRGSMADTVTLRATRQVVIDDLNAIAGYVQAVARQAAPSSNIWVQYGLVALARFARKHQRRTPQLNNHRSLGAPVALRSQISKNIRTGSTNVRWNKVKHAAAYNVWDYNGGNPTFITTITKTNFSEFIGLGNSKTYVISTVDKFGTTGGQSVPFLAQALIPKV